MKTLATFLIVVLIAFGPLHGQESKEYNSLPSKYFIGNSSFSLKKGQAYYANTLFVFNNFQYGLSNRITIGGGFGIIPFTTPVWFNIKAAYPIVKNSLSVNVCLASYNFIFETSEIDKKSNNTSHNHLSIMPVPLPSFGFTLGNFQNNLSVNYYYIFGSAFIKPSYLVISGKVSITPQTSFIMDNKIIGPYVGVIGFRTATHRIIFDYGLLVFPSFNLDFDIDLSEASPPPPSVERNYSGYQASFSPYLGLKVLIGKNW